MSVAVMNTSISGCSAARRITLHPGKRIQEPCVHRLAAEQAARKFVAIQQILDVGLVEPQPAHLVERLPVGEGFPQKYRVDAAGRGSRCDIHQEPGTHGPIRRAREFPVHPLGSAQLRIAGDQFSFRVYSRGPNQMEKFLRDSVDVDRERCAAVQHQRKANFFSKAGVGGICPQYSRCLPRSAGVRIAQVGRYKRLIYDLPAANFNSSSGTFRVAGFGRWMGMIRSTSRCRRSMFASRLT